MAKKLKRTHSAGSREQFADQVKDSAQKIWLAGLGAFSRAQEEGGKVFETLVKQGQEIEKKTRSIAEKAAESARAQATETVGRAAGKWDKLEQVFEDRVHRSLNKLGVLTSKDVERLTRQLSELSENVRSLVGGKAAAKKARPAAKKAAKKSAGKTAKPAAKRAAKTAKRGA